MNTLIGRPVNEACASFHAMLILCRTGGAGMIPMAAEQLNAPSLNPFHPQPG
jgi:hypothetical protein